MAYKNNVRSFAVEKYKRAAKEARAARQKLEAALAHMRVCLDSGEGGRDALGVWQCYWHVA